MRFSLYIIYIYVYYMCIGQFQLLCFIHISPGSKILYTMSRNDPCQFAKRW